MNHLAQERSPYLQQHAHNPVHWYPWGPEAFKKAAAEDKLVFLSIGYSTCHWCHVMEKESFENDEIAALLNQDFVSIKVDREERPDIDHIYMNIVQGLTGSGGWPLSVFMTPDGSPFTGGTYFPPEDGWGRPGLRTILPRLVQLWKEKRDELKSAGAQITEAIQPKSHAHEESFPGQDLLDLAVRQYESQFDADYGGFGGAPKFPRSHDLSFLLRYYARTGHQASLEMTVKTLDCMADGGICDHLGGGFARYATDEKWRIPHFEKMLYDQALLARVYLEAYLVTRHERYEKVVRHILRYVVDELTGTQGGFYCGEDADSEGEEGKYYVWQAAEITRLLGEKNGKIFCEYYGVTEEGNFESHASVLYVSEPVETFARGTGLERSGAEQLLQEGRKILYAARNKRGRPHKDDKILTAWNGLMISAFAEAGAALQDKAYLAQAEKAACFVKQNLVRNGRLLRRYRGGEAGIAAFQDDYAFLGLAFLDLYEATFAAEWLEAARQLARDMMDLFYDREQGGFFYTGRDAEKLLFRTKEHYDGAVPAGNSAAARLLIRLCGIDGTAEYENTARQVILSVACSLNQYPVSYSELLWSVEMLLFQLQTVRLAGDEKSAEYQAMKKCLDSAFLPYTVTVRDPGAMNRPAAYLCRGQVCQAPLYSAEDLRGELSRLPAE